MKKSLLIASLAVISMNVLGMLPNDPNDNFGEGRKRNYGEISENTGESSRNVRPRVSLTENAIGIQNSELNVNSLIQQLNLCQSMLNDSQTMLSESQSLVRLYQQQAVRDDYEKKQLKQQLDLGQQRANEFEKVLLNQSREIEELKSDDSYVFLSIGRRFPKLKTLKIKGSDLSRLSIENLSLPNLAELHISDMSSDNLNEVNELISRVSPTLQQLKLIRGWYNEKVFDIPDSVWRCENLINLKVEGKISSLPAEIGNLTKLEKLDFEDNKLRTLPSEIGNLINLKYLNLSVNLIETLPSEIGNLENLEELYIFENDLKAFPPEIGKLKKLKKLGASDNEELSVIPSEIGNLIDLTYLCLDFTDMNEQPQEIWKLKNLEDVLFRDEFSIRRFIVGNQEYMEDNAFMYWAKKIDLSNENMDLTTLPVEIIMCENVREINLRNNRLPEIPDLFSRFTKLQKLNISKNDQINSIDKINTEIFGLPRLESVILSAHLNEIPEIESIENGIGDGRFEVKYKNPQDENLIKVLNQEDNGKFLVEYTKEGINKIRRERIREKKREIPSLLENGVSSYLYLYGNKFPMNDNQLKKHIEWWKAEDIKVDSLKHMIDTLKSAENYEINSDSGSDSDSE